MFKNKKSLTNISKNLSFQRISKKKTKLIYKKEEKTRKNFDVLITDTIWLEIRSNTNSFQFKLDLKYGEFPQHSILDSSRFVWCRLLISWGTRFYLIEREWCCGRTACMWGYIEEGGKDQITFVCTGKKWLHLLLKRR